MEFGKPRQSITGIVSADEDRVWGALLETSPYLTPGMREMIAGSRGVLRFPARQAEGHAEASPVPGVNVDADGSQHTLAISGQWWFRGVYSTSPQGPGTLLRYQVFNVAPGLTRWLVPLVAGPALRASARPQFERALTAIGALLGCPVQMTATGELRKLSEGLHMPARHVECTDVKAVAGDPRWPEAVPPVRLGVGMVARRDWTRASGIGCWFTMARSILCRGLTSPAVKVMTA